MVSARHVLFVEDASDLRDPLTALFEMKGYRVGWASNGWEALDYLRTGEPPGLILLDLRLPVMDGWQFRRRQQQDPTLACIPVVLVSGTDDLPRSAADLGATAYLAKPVTLQKLVETIRQHCGSGWPHGQNPGTCSGAPSSPPPLPFPWSEAPQY